MCWKEMQKKKRKISWLSDRTATGNKLPEFLTVRA